MSQASNIVRIGVLDDADIKDLINELLDGYANRENYMSRPSIGDVITLAGGYPYAAKFIALRLKSISPEDLIAETGPDRVELRVARDIITATDEKVLNAPLFLLILHILAVVGEPISMQDMLSVTELKRYSLSDIQQARATLTEMYLIEQDNELMFLHRFIKLYYSEDVKRDPKKYTAIAKPFAEYAQNKSIELNKTLQNLKLQRPHKHNVEYDNKVQIVSNEILRYAVSADRLLRTTGNETLANKLPIQFKGTLRELVYHFYQDKRDFAQALFYAKKWLELKPDDYRIALFEARCYRNIRDRENLRKADELLDKLWVRAYTNQAKAEILREKALVADFGGDEKQAEANFREGIRYSDSGPHYYSEEFNYTENYVGLANLYLRQAQRLPPFNPSRDQLINNAISLFEFARGRRTDFDAYHLKPYVEALLEQENEKALPLIENALKHDPRDARLNYGLAEIYRKREDYDKAIKYAEYAKEYGEPKALLTLANIAYSKAINLNTSNSVRIQLLEQAEKYCREFIPVFGSNERVADAILSKILRAAGRVEAAIELLAKYEEVDDPFVLFERCMGYQSRADEAFKASDQLRELDSLRTLIRIIEQFNQQANARFISIYSSATQRINAIEDTMHS
ncbi:MAG: hypothetical protein KF726_10715 [Anaerolineae bacterium]|nr:hypothetical protein [Anaerolineae bacterium]